MVKTIDTSHIFHVTLVFERILLSRVGGGTGPMKPSNLHIVQGANLWQGIPLNDKSER